MTRETMPLRASRISGTGCAIRLQSCRSRITAVSFKAMSNRRAAWASSGAPPSEVRHPPSDSAVSLLLRTDGNTNGRTVRSDMAGATIGVPEAKAIRVSTVPSSPRGALNRYVRSACAMATGRISDTFADESEERGSLVLTSPSSTSALRFLPAQVDRRACERVGAGNEK